MRNSSRSQRKFFAFLLVIAALAPGLVAGVVSKTKLRSVETPVTGFVGEEDPIRRIWAAPHEKERADRPVVEIAGVGHMPCVIMPAFADTVVRAVTV
jgi:pimeloyl-ACP methyl ester carboxylesterase